MEKRLCEGRQDEKMAVCRPRGEASGETKCADTLIIDFQPPECALTCDKISDV